MIQDFLSTNNFNFIQILIVTIGYLMPIPLAYIALNIWHHYRQERFITGIKWVLLEIHVPRDVIKTPATMELIFSTAFYHQGSKSFWDQYVVGIPWPSFSLELVSIDGSVHFYIRTPVGIRNLVETQIYAQYPQAKVIEVEDYVFNIPQYTKVGDWNVWGCEFTKLKEDFLPIKTYKGFGEDMKTGIKEEFKIDPITPTIELLGSLPKGQQIWMQIMIRPTIKTYHSSITGKTIKFYDASIEFIENFLKTWIKTTKDEKGVVNKQLFLPKHLDPIVTTINDQAGKIHFDCGIRLMVLSDKRLFSDDQFRNLWISVGLVFHQYKQPFSNEFSRVNSTSVSSAWADPTGLALTSIKKRMLDFYRMRTFFHPPIQYAFKYSQVLSLFFPSGKPNIFVLSSEELATIYHFPGMVSETPSFKRIESKIAKPPSNLPI